MSSMRVNFTYIYVCREQERNLLQRWKNDVYLTYVQYVDTKQSVQSVHIIKHKSVQTRNATSVAFMAEVMEVVTSESCLLRLMLLSYAYLYSIYFRSI